jgi:formimidoylglutamate deiminase
LTSVYPDHVWTAEGLRSDIVVRIDGDTIIGLETAGSQPVDVRLPGALLLPGLVDVHSHAFQRAFRGHVQWRAGDRDDFWTWRDAMYRTANALPPDGIEAVSRLAFLGLAEAGVTRVGEFHYLHHAHDGTPYADPDELAHRVIAAALDVGIRVDLLRAVYGRHSAPRELQPEQRRFGDRGPDDALAAIARMKKRYAAEPRVTVGLAPHSVRAVPPAWLRELSSFRDGVVHAHVAEQPREVEECRGESGRGPLAVLADAGLVTERFTAVHLTWPDPGDADLVRAAGASVCACPSTEMDLGDGFLPLSLRTGDTRLCVGSDSHAVHDPLGEARTLELHARALAGRRNVMAVPGDRHAVAERILRAASIDGGRALGGAGEGIRVGAPADLVAIDLDRTAAAGVPPLEAAAFVSTPDWVVASWVGGRPVISHGRHPARERIVVSAQRWL